MFKFLKSAAVIVGILAAPATVAEDPQIHYMGFNAFGADKAKSSEVFDAYLETLRPIMARYEMTADAYNVVHGGSDNLRADVVTFGTAKDQASFQAFFQDPEFQKIFPMLLGALDDHQVVFTSGAFVPNPQHGAHTLLSASWFKDGAEAPLKTMASINHKIEPVFAKYGVEMLGHTAGVYSNRGLAAEVKDTHAPQLIELWSIKDAHGFLDDPLMKEAGHDLEALVERSEDFWIVRRPVGGHGHH